ncbi:hypothetical protein [Salinilacihabitans rarus]|uniref:hypothetical protein n=1 Tax=Salinilacihabitans rarus TaxID=2961596 RepID=UPI0020C88C61|nr:hypothetical protein [Salinilacihabitans rarus]
MIADVLRYPVVDPGGRTALLWSAGAVLALAVGRRYAGALAPDALAVVPAAFAVVAVVALLGTLSAVLVAAPSTPRSSVRDGAAALALSVALLAPPAALLAVTVSTAGGGDPRTAALPFLVGSTAATLLFGACAYALPAALAAATRAGRLRAALDGAVVATLADARYFLRWVVGFALAVAGAGLAGVTARSGDATGLLAAAGAGYLLVAGARSAGVGYARATGTKTSDRP